MTFILCVNFVSTVIFLSILIQIIWGLAREKYYEILIMSLKIQ